MAKNPKVSASQDFEIFYVIHHCNVQNQIPQMEINGWAHFTKCIALMGS